MRLRADEIARITGGEVVAGDPNAWLDSVEIDSRAVAAGSLFVALPGERVDGHEFVAQAIRTGAGGSLVARAPEPTGGAAPIIMVPDTLQALQDLASNWRSRMTAKVVGVAGSNGKTTTKESLAAVCAEAGRSWATPGNHNSQIGTPLTILAAPLDLDFLVLELGTSQPGELARLTGFARPDHAIITAAFAEHLEWLQDVAGVIAAETEILDGLPDRALALIGSEEPGLVEAARARTHLRIEPVGRRNDDRWRIADMNVGRSGTSVSLADPDGDTETWSIPLLGTPAAWAAAFAVAMARELEIPSAVIAEGLAKVSPAAHRLAPRRHDTQPLFILDDCYNSNPASCIAAVETVARLADPGDRLILVIGDMLELGAATEESHREIGEAIPALAPDAELLLVGESVGVTADAMRARGAQPASAPDASAALDHLRSTLADGRPTTLLIKASRGIGLDAVVDTLLADESS